MLNILRTYPPSTVVSHTYTDYQAVQQLFAAGHEIADHTTDHLSIMNSGTNVSQALSLRSLLADYASVPASAISGFRAPFLSYSSAYFEGLSQKCDPVVFTARILTFTNQCTEQAVTCACSYLFVSTVASSMIVASRRPPVQVLPFLALKNKRFFRTRLTMGCWVLSRASLEFVTTVQFLLFGKCQCTTSCRPMGDLLGPWYA